MRTLPRAPFSESASISCAASRSAQTIIDEVIETITAQIENQPYEGEADAFIPKKIGDPDIDTIQDAFGKATEGKGFIEAVVKVIGNGYSFEVKWETPYSQVCALCADTNVFEECKYHAIAKLIQKRDPNFRKIEDGVWSLDIDTDELECDDIRLTTVLYREYDIKAFIRNGHVYIFTDKNLNS